MAEEKKVKTSEKQEKVADKFAVIRTGGKQYVVKEGQTLEVELLGQDEGTFEFETLLVSDEGKVEVGTPVVSNAKVVASVLGETKGEKQIVFKFKKRKNYRVKTGHRQHYSHIKIEKITLK